MATIAIGAIGVANYTEIKYKFSDGYVVTSPYSLHALIQRENIKFDKTIVLLTDGARKNSWDLMKVYLDEHVNAGQICDVSIKDGRDEVELWAIFDAIVENVKDGDELYIDITNGLRHLPVLLLIACSYLRAAKNVVIKSISYGAFELGKKELKNERPITTECDVFELLPYVALFDWSSGTRTFQRTGDASVLAELLRMNSVGLNSDVSGQLNNVAEKLDNVTLALELARPEEARAEIDALTRKLEVAQENLKQYAKPFALLNNLLRTTFKKIPYSGLGESSVKIRLETQRNLIKWYESNRHLALSVQLAREWLVSKHMVDKGNDTKIQNYRDRDEAGRELGKRVNSSIEMYDVWEELRKIRNDIAHMGQSKDDLKAKDLQMKIKNTLKMLNTLKLK